MAIIRRVVCVRNIWRLASALNYINILQPVYFNVFLHDYLLQSRCNRFGVISLNNLTKKVKTIQNVNLVKLVI